MVKLVLLQESNAHTMADRFLSMVVSQHRLPEYIMSKHDPHLHSHFWDELLSLLDIIFTLSMDSHPHTNRMAEVTKHTMK